MHVSLLPSLLWDVVRTTECVDGAHRCDNVTVGNENHPVLLVLWEWVWLLRKLSITGSKGIAGQCEVRCTDGLTVLQAQTGSVYRGDERTDGELCVRRLRTESHDQLLHIE